MGLDRLGSAVYSCRTGDGCERDLEEIIDRLTATAMVVHPDEYDNDGA